MNQLPLNVWAFALAQEGCALELTVVAGQTHPFKAAVAWKPVADILALIKADKDKIEDPDGVEESLFAEYDSLLENEDMDDLVEFLADWDLGELVYTGVKL